MRIRNNKQFNVSIQGKHTGKGIPPRANLIAGSVLTLDDQLWKDNFAESEAVKSSIKSGAFEIVKAPALSIKEEAEFNEAQLKAAEKLIADNKIAVEAAAKKAAANK